MAVFQESTVSGQEDYERFLWASIIGGGQGLGTWELSNVPSHEM